MPLSYGSAVARAAITAQVGRVLTECMVPYRVWGMWVLSVMLCHDCLDAAARESSPYGLI